MMIEDLELRALAMDRRRLMRQLAPVLRRVGPNKPRAVRSKINQARAQQRGVLRSALRKNAELIAARLLTLIGEDDGD